MSQLASALRTAGIIPMSPAAELEHIIRQVCEEKFPSERLMRRAIWVKISDRADLLLILMDQAKWGKDGLLVSFMATLNMPVEDSSIKHLREQAETRRENARENAKYSRARTRHYIDNPQEPIKLQDVIKGYEDTITAKAVEEYKNSILFKFSVNGKSIGDLLPKEVFGWMDNNQQKMDFLGMMLSGVNLHDPRLIKDIISPEEANKQWLASGGKL